MFSSGFKLIKVERLDCESFQDYLERSYFIINNLKNQKFSYEQIVEKSLLYNSIRVLKCGYSEEVLNEIKKMSDYAGVRIEK